MPPRLLKMSNISLAGLVILLTGSLAFLSNMIYLHHNQPQKVILRTSPVANFTTLTLVQSNQTNTVAGDNNTQVPPSVILEKFQAPKEAIITMFTSFRYSAKKLIIHKNTVRNWSMLRPYVVPVLFADRDELNDELYNFIISHGWTIATIPKRSPGGIPVLRHMYLAAEKFFNTALYCFANSDILFTPEFIRTLEMAILPYRNQLQGLMLVGKRTNVPMEPNKEIKWFDEVYQLAKNGSLFGENAQDYFVTTRGGFPWDRIPDFVIGRAGYDNWLVAKAMMDRITTIDGTVSILAFHQSGHDGDFAWKAQKSEKDFNFDLGGAKIFYKIGHTNCAPFLTKWCSVGHNTTVKTGTDSSYRESCPTPIVLAKRTIDHCYRLRRKLGFKSSRLINFKERIG